LNINSEKFISQDSGDLDNQSILTEYLLDDIENPNDLKRLSFVNTDETRALLLEDSKKFRDFSFSFFFITNDNKRVSVLMDKGQEFNIKLRISDY
jgi:hypothetical protein